MNEQTCSTCSEWSRDLDGECNGWCHKRGWPMAEDEGCEEWEADE